MDDDVVELLVDSKPLLDSSSSLSIFMLWFCVILLNSVRYELRISRCLDCVCNIAFPVGLICVILSFMSANFVSISLTSALIVSKENSDDINGVVSPMLPPLLILLSATSFKSMAFSKFRDFFLSSETSEDSQNHLNILKSQVFDLVLTVPWFRHAQISQRLTKHNRKSTIPVDLTKRFLKFFAEYLQKQIVTAFLKTFWTSS